MTNCTGLIGHDGRCLECKEVVFPHIWERVQRKRMKPARRDGRMPVGIRRNRKANA